MGKIFQKPVLHAWLRLPARDSGGLAIVSEVVVQDQLQNGHLQKYRVLDDVVKRIYAITAKQHYKPAALKTLLKAEKHEACLP